MCPRVRVRVARRAGDQMRLKLHVLDLLVGNWRQLQVLASPARIRRQLQVLASPARIRRQLQGLASDLLL